MLKFCFSFFFEGAAFLGAIGLVVVVVSELAGGGVDGVDGVVVDVEGNGSGDSFPENAFSMIAFMIASSALLLVVVDFVFLVAEPASSCFNFSFM